MKSVKVTDSSDYLLLHLMDGIDTGYLEPGTCFRLKLQIFTGANVENVNSSRNTLDKILPDCRKKDELTTHKKLKLEKITTETVTESCKVVHVKSGSKYLPVPRRSNDAIDNVFIGRIWSLF